MKKRCVIVGAVDIGPIPLIKSYIKDDDFMIFCDGGLAHREALGREPDLIVADFDSHPKGDYNAETIVLPHVKDDTDTWYAAKVAIERGFDDFLFIGCIGKRLDHTFGNISILLHLDTLGLHALMLDAYSELEIVSSSTAYIEPSFKYFSLVNVDGPAEGVVVKDAFYSLDGKAFDPNFALGISNEPLPGKTASVSVSKGRMLLIRVFDT